jgi:hypothetical protein
MKAKLSVLFAFLFVLLKADAQFSLSAKINENYNLSGKNQSYRYLI